ncbi:cell division FtsA domain-containing protein [Proteinivorax hydrogeniformans]|uniref:Cell division FtsA domain-containing protein n=1 Tax=Proteinivorax hydrogeniformans TaxID=1826727 RepID=A0AAU8HTW7_9FIRM
MENQYIFALDIGTRTVIGLVCKMVEEDIHVVAHQIERHQGRAMRDGQIHDIKAVAMAVEKVKTKLEKKLGVSLKYASIAAAGRALRTERGNALEKVYKEKPLTSEDVERLKLAAVGDSKEKIQTKYPNEHLYCVGYTVTETQIDGYQITNLEGQKGSEVSLEIISTYLPQVVIDSLFEVLKRAQISIKSLTLEPIAAMDIAIKENLRMLNIALVDVGAGTSDIAICKGGTVVGYGMVQKAGDKVTEALSDHYLLDFQLSEKIKLEFSKKNKVAFKDVLGIKNEVSKEEFCKVIKPAVEDVAESIAKEIVKLNRAVPKAVFCIGGGSQIPMFKEILADKLELPRERVAIRDRQSLEGVKFPSRQLTGPDVITPLGIASVADKTIDPNFFVVKVNGQQVSIFNSKKTKVAQALFNAGVEVKDLFGSTNKISYTINGEKFNATAKRKPPSLIKVNGAMSNLDAKIKSGDSIELISDSQHKGLSLKEILTPYEGKIEVDGKKIDLVLEVILNGTTADNLSTEVRDGDNIEIKKINTLADLAANMDVNLGKYNIIAGDTILSKHDFITPKMNLITKKVKNVIEEENRWQDAPVNSNKEKKRNNGIKLWGNGKEITISKENPKIVDVFDALQVDISNPKGSLILTKNNKETDFTEPVQDGDKVKIYWSEN